jgi:hypothetical protein
VDKIRDEVNRGSLDERSYCLVRSCTGPSTGTIAGVVAMPNQVSTRGMMSLRASECEVVRYGKDHSPEQCNRKESSECKRDRVDQLPFVNPTMEKSVLQRLQTFTSK